MTISAVFRIWEDLGENILIIFSPFKALELKFSKCELKQDLNYMELIHGLNEVQDPTHSNILNYKLF